jgi:carbon-monoxide dehydrogenase large subunit
MLKVEASRKIKDEATAQPGRYAPEDLSRHGFDVTVFRSQKEQLNAFGANLLTAHLDESGSIRVKECMAYCDVGRQLNPAMIESQIMGGSAQDIGQVLNEQVMYDEDGQLLTATITDAGISSGLAMPVVVIKLANVPSSLPHRAKGVGESPTMGIPPAAMRAIETILGKRLREMPIPIELITIGYHQKDRGREVLTIYLRRPPELVAMSLSVELGGSEITFYRKFSAGQSILPAMR